MALCCEAKSGTVLYGLVSCVLVLFTDLAVLPASPPSMLPCHTVCATGQSKQARPPSVQHLALSRSCRPGSRSTYAATGKQSSNIPCSPEQLHAAGRHRNTQSLTFMYSQALSHTVTHFHVYSSVRWTGLLGVCACCRRGAARLATSILATHIQTLVHVVQHQ